MARGDVPDAPEDGLAAQDEFWGRLPAFPNGCVVCEVEIDLETGTVAITRYSTVDDVGRVINPMIVQGQIHGALAQGIGQALMEHSVYDPESGQPVAGKFMKKGKKAGRKSTGYLKSKGDGSESQKQRWEFHELRPSDIHVKPER